MAEIFRFGSALFAPAKRAFHQHEDGAPYVLGKYIPRFNYNPECPLRQVRRQKTLGVLATFVLTWSYRDPYAV